MDLFEKVKGFLAEPIRLFDVSKDEKLEEAVKYYMLIAAVFSLLLSIMIALIYSIVIPMVSKYISIESGGIVEIFSNFFMSFILMLIFVFVWGAILHGMAYILGGRWEISRTVRVAMYSSTPLILLGWMPIFGIFGWIWAGALNVVGLHQYQDLPEGKAIAAVLIPVILLLIIAIVVMAVMVSVIIPFAMTGFSV